jgi:hypothetical protein
MRIRSVLCVCVLCVFWMVTNIHAEERDWAFFREWTTNGLLAKSSITVTNATLTVDTTATGIASGDAMAAAVKLTNVVDTAGGSIVLQCVSVFTGDNQALPLRMLFTGRPISNWPATNAVVNLLSSEVLTNFVKVVDVTAGDYMQVGTNWSAL